MRFSPRKDLRCWITRSVSERLRNLRTEGRNWKVAFLDLETGIELGLIQDIPDGAVT